MAIYRAFKGWPRSRRVTRARYPEEWAWWAASGWEMIVEDTPGGGLLLSSHKQKTTGGSVLWGGRAEPEEVATVAGVRRFLTESLYYHLHPRKAAVAVGAYGMVCTEKELAAFIRQQRRKMSARPLMWVNRTGS
jgi:hypothetical protein